MADEQPTRESGTTWYVVLLVALALGALLRFWDLGGPSISHPEIYVPGIDLIAGLSEPPPRHGFLETLRWHFQLEPHPEGWYMVMWAWTKLAGTSTFALRFPGALLGVAAIWTIWRLGKRAFGAEVGAAAALLLALNGFHIYWSQNARMYAMGTFLSLAATLALVELVRRGERRPWLEAGYVAALVLGTQCVELFWAIIFLHLAWIALVVPATGRLGLADAVLPWRAPVARLAQLPAMALALSSFEFIHILLLARHGAAPDPEPRFLIEYANYGFIFDSDGPAGNFPSPALSVALVIALSAIGLGLWGLRMPAAQASRETPAPIPFWIVLLAALVGVALTLLCASAAPRHRSVFMGFAILPVLCLWLPVLAAFARQFAARLASERMARFDRSSPFPLLVLLLAAVPPLVFYAASVKMSVLAPRAFLLFTPYLLLLVAAGLAALGSRTLRPICGIAVLLLCVSGCFYAFERPHGPRDYKRIAAIIEPAQRPGDVIMVRARNWADTPSFYYLRRDAFVTEQQVAGLGPKGPPRIWMLYWTNDPRPYGFAQLAAAGYRKTSATPVMGGEVQLYQRPGA